MTRGTAAPRRLPGSWTRPLAGLRSYRDPSVTSGASAGHGPPDLTFARPYRRDRLVPCCLVNGSLLAVAQPLLLKRIVDDGIAGAGTPRCVTTAAASWFGCSPWPTRRSVTVGRWCLLGDRRGADLRPAHARSSRTCRRSRWPSSPVRRPAALISPAQLRRHRRAAGLHLDPGRRLWATSISLVVVLIAMFGAVLADHGGQPGAAPGVPAPGPVAGRRLQRRPANDAPQRRHVAR